MSTIKLYYDIPAQTSIQARVVSVSKLATGQTALILDSSNFYPEGGGQPCDTGTIAGLTIGSVIEADGEVVHLVSDPGDAIKAAGILPGTTVTCVVDIPRRTDHTEQHTAQHLLSAVIQRLVGGTTLSFHLGERYSSVDLDIPVMDKADAEFVEAEVLRVIRDDCHVTTHLCPPEDPAAFPLRKEPTVDADVLRVVEIDGYDYSACCGTHAESTGKLGAFRIIKTEKYKGGSRVYFVAGTRAYDDYRRLAGIVRDAAAAAGVAEESLAQSMATYKEKITIIEKALEEASSRAAHSEAARLDREIPAGRSICLAAENFDSASKLAKALAALGRVAVVHCQPDLKVVVACPSGMLPDGKPPLDAGAVFGPKAKAAGGRGGGGRTFFQAAFPDAAMLEAFLADVGV